MHSHILGILLKEVSAKTKTELDTYRNYELHIVTILTKRLASFFFKEPDNEFLSFVAIQSLCSYFFIFIIWQLFKNIKDILDLKSVGWIWLRDPSLPILCWLFFP